MTGDDDLLVVWQDGSGSVVQLGAARVTKDGAVTQLRIRSTTAVTCDLVMRYGQAGLVRLEAGGVGPNWITAHKHLEDAWV